MQSHLTILKAHNVDYQWGFPFAVIFSYKGKWDSVQTVEALHLCLQDLWMLDETNTGATHPNTEARK